MTEMTRNQNDIGKLNSWYSSDKILCVFSIFYSYPSQSRRTSPNDSQLGADYLI